MQELLPRPRPQLPRTVATEHPGNHFLLPCLLFLLALLPTAPRPRLVSQVPRQVSLNLLARLLEGAARPLAGLGLYLVKSIVKQLRGRVFVKGRLTKRGTIIEVDLQKGNSSEDMPR